MDWQHVGHVLVLFSAGFVALFNLALAGGTLAFPGFMSRSERLGMTGISQRSWPARLGIAAAFFAAGCLALLWIDHRGYGILWFVFFLGANRAVNGKPLLPRQLKRSPRPSA